MRSVLVLGVLMSSYIALGASAQSPADPFVLNVDREGSFSVAGTGVALSESAVIDQAAAALDRDASTALVVEGEERAPLDSVKRAAELLQRAGATRIWFRTAVEPSLQ